MSVELMNQGAAIVPDLYPDIATRKAAAPRLYARARALLDSDDRTAWCAGFFLFGMSEAAAGRASNA